MFDEHHHDEINPLLKQVPGQLFAFEERIFGLITLPQLLSDLVAGIAILALTGDLPLSSRLIVAGVLALPALALIHGKVAGQTLLSWMLLSLRTLFLARHATWQSLEDRHHDEHTKRKKAERQEAGASIQATWIALDTIEQGIAGYSEPGRKGPAGRYWIALECEGRNLRLLPQAEQIKHFTRWESSLCGLEFGLHFLTHVEQVDAQQHPPMVEQRKALLSLTTTPRLASLQQASLQHQEQHLQDCTLVRHFVVLTATAQEEASRANDGEPQGVLSFFWRRLFQPRSPSVPRQQVVDQLRVRLSVLRKILQQIEVRCWTLDDTDLLKQFVMSLTPGAEVPTFTPELLEEVPQVALRSAPHPTETKAVAPATTSQPYRRGYKKSIKGLHAKFLYQSPSPQARFEAGAVQLADLVAPSQIDVTPAALEVSIRGKKRYQRYLHITGYGHQLLCGWVADLTDLGIPMLISLKCEPLDSQYMINRLEMQLVRLESRRIADQKAVRIGHAGRTIEADQIRKVAHALAARRLKIFAVQMTIGIHGETTEQLEQRTRLLLSHLRQKQLKARLATRRHDQAWQGTLPGNAMVEMGSAVNLGSDVLSSFLHLSTSTIGTPTGVFMGYTGSGASRRPVYLNPWSADRRIPNPHIVVVGESGMGKSFAGKTFVSGIMGMGIADVVVLDRDDDYLPLHEYLDGESQRYNLARGCPLNFFDLPYGPQDVDPDDPADLLAEFIDNSLLAGLALLLCDTDTRLSKIEEAYLMHVARLTYAQRGITSEAIRSAPSTLLGPMPTLSDFIETMMRTPASSESMQESLVERLEKASYLFSGQTSVTIEKPLTIFSIHDLDDKWYALMTYVVQNYLMRHRALRRDERYLAYVVEEASYMLKHAAGRKYLESGSRGFRKLGIAQITLSQHPREFLREGAVILNNAGCACFLGMQQYAAQELHLPEELERTLTAAIPGQMVMRLGNEYAAVTIDASPLHQRIFTTAPQDQRTRREQEHHQRTVLAS